MDPKTQRAKSIFIALVGKVQPEHWDSHLEVACGEDQELRRTTRFTVRGPRVR